MTKRDEKFMRAALNEARRALGLTSPNPAVGAVLVVSDQIIARGHHQKAGSPHAEIECLRQMTGGIPKSATLYITLEPCSTAGRTPPCIDEIIKARVKNVIIGALDVNPRHAGRGIDLLRNAGIKVQVGLLADECTALNESFNKWVTTRRPFVIAKCGMSLDGRLTRPAGESQWITNAATRHHAHELRGNVDAILVGAETVRADNPHLTVRSLRGKKQPLRVILSRSGRLPKSAHIFNDRFAKQTVIYRGSSLGAVLKDLGQKNVTSVLIEGGGEILGQALDQQLIDKMQLYFGPIFSGGPVLAFSGRGVGSTAAAGRLSRVIYRKIGNDVCVTGYPIYSERADIE